MIITTECTYALIKIVTRGKTLVQLTKRKSMLMKTVKICKYPTNAIRDSIADSKYGISFSTLNMSDS